MTDEALLRLFGERLSGIRLARNLTQQQLAVSSPFTKRGSSA